MGYIGLVAAAMGLPPVLPEKPSVTRCLLYLPSATGVCMSKSCQDPLLCASASSETLHLCWACTILTWQ